VQRRHHYEVAFEHYLRDHRLPYVAVHEARKALIPEDAGQSLKSFDFVLYGEGLNLLAEIKGRRVGASPMAARPRPARLESWATQDDVDSLLAWERLFGDGFSGALVFVYWCDRQPPTPLFEDVFEFKGCWYAIRTVLVRDYAGIMKPRSPRWRTVHAPVAAFDRASRSLSAALNTPFPPPHPPHPLHPLAAPVASAS
jgi:hypothetical protein